MRFREIAEDVFHGTPHRFNQFSTDFVGTGEGNQVYGWGLYFASTEDVAKLYKRKLSRTNVDALTRVATEMGVDLDLAKTLAETFVSTDGRDMWLTAFKETMMAPGPVPAMEEFRSRMRAIFQSGIVEQVWKAFQDAGHLYHVEIPDEGAYLLWDEPLDSQPEQVKAVLKKLGVSYANWWGFSDAPVSTGEIRCDLKGSITVDGKTVPYTIFLGEILTNAGFGTEDDEPQPATAFEVVLPWRGVANKVFYSEEEAIAYVEQVGASKIGKEMNHATGKSLYKTVARLMDSSKAASLELLKHGIPGIKYLDGNSRSAGSGTHNYVLFDASLARIKTRHGN